MTFPKKLAAYSKYVAKALATLVGVASMAVSQGLLSGSAAKWVAVGIAAATSLGVYFVPNGPSPNQAPAAGG